MIPPLHILLVEDNPINQKVAARLLEREGHRVTIAANGKEALACLVEACFDLVLMDLQMPEMDGLEATQEIRRQEAGQAADGSRRLPIVALTAHALVGDRERCLAAGMDGYVSKPVQSHVLFQAMAEALGLARSA
jgi:CheY-like chemotaxis protein